MKIELSPMFGMPITRPGDIVKIDSFLPEAKSPTEQILEELMQLPPKGIPIDQLTSQQKLALAVAAGARYTTEMVEGELKVTTIDLVGFSIGEDGRYVVAVRRP